MLSTNAKLEPTLFIDNKTSLKKIKNLNAKDIVSLSATVTSDRVKALVTDKVFLEANVIPAIIGALPTSVKVIYTRAKLQQSQYMSIPKSAEFLISAEEDKENLKSYPEHLWILCWQKPIKGSERYNLLRGPVGYELVVEETNEDQAPSSTSVVAQQNYPIVLDLSKVSNPPKPKTKKRKATNSVPTQESNLTYTELLRKYNELQQNYTKLKEAYINLGVENHKIRSMIEFLQQNNLQQNTAIQAELFQTLGVSPVGQSTFAHPEFIVYEAPVPTQNDYSFEKFLGLTDQENSSISTQEVQEINLNPTTLPQKEKPSSTPTPQVQEINWTLTQFAKKPNGKTQRTQITEEQPDMYFGLSKTNS